MRNYYWVTKVEKADKGAKLAGNAKNRIGNSAMIERVIKWADGVDDCGA